MSKTIRKGDIVLVRFPFTDLSASKVRPALVLVGEDELGDVCLAFITSHHIRPSSYDLSLPQGKVTGLKVDSVVRLKKIATIHRNVIAGTIGTLPKILLSQVSAKLIALFQLTEN